MGWSARFQLQCRRQDLGANYRLRVGARLVLSQIFAAGPRDRVGVACRKRANLQPAAAKLQRGRSARREVSVPASLAAAHRTYEDLLVGHDYPDDYRNLGVFFGPDRDFRQIAQLAQGVRIELRHCLSLPYGAPTARCGRPQKKAKSERESY